MRLYNNVFGPFNPRRNGIDTLNDYFGGQLASLAAKFRSPDIFITADKSLPDPISGTRTCTITAIEIRYGYLPTLLGSISQKIGDKHNKIDTDGIFVGIKIPSNRIPKICEKLPVTATEMLTKISETCKILLPTSTEKFIGASKEYIYGAKEGAIHGFIRGTANVFGQRFLTSANKPIKFLFTEGVYFSSMFAYQYLLASQNAEESDSYYDTAYEALVKASYIFSVNTAVSATCKALNIASKYASDCRWTRSSIYLNRISNGIRFSLFATTAIDQGLTATATSVLTGAAVQTAIEAGLGKPAHPATPSGTQGSGSKLKRT